MRAAALCRMPPIRVVRNSAHSPMTANDYTAPDRPTVQRQRAVGDGLRAEAAMAAEEMLDIPAFLRRQAD